MVIQGVIRPPPEIRAVADRTALYVAKNGRAFESRILGSAKGKTPKFAFLHATSPFHAYYEQRVQFYESGGTDEQEKEEEERKRKEEENKKKDGGNSEADKKPKPAKLAPSKKASVIDPVAKALLEQRSKILKIQSDHQEVQKKIEAEATTTSTEGKPLAPAPIPSPPPLRFVNIIPPGSLSVAQLETIQLVAQFTALLDGKQSAAGGGTSFLSQLCLREWNNPTFSFCQPRHGHFAYFSALVDGYRYILQTWKPASESEADKQSAVPGDDLVSELLKNGATTSAIQNACMERAAYRAEHDRFVEQSRQSRENSEAQDEAARLDWHDFVVVETIDFGVDEIVEVSMPPPPPPPPPPVAVAAKPKVEDDGMDESDSDDEDRKPAGKRGKKDEPIRVVPTYTPKVVSSKQTADRNVYIDPISGKAMPIGDMSEHMRIQLLDPKWAEERKKFQEKQKESNLVSGDVVASNLARMAAQAAPAKRPVAEAQQGQPESGYPIAAPPPSGLPLPPLPPPPAEMEPAAKRPKLEEPVKMTHLEAPPVPGSAAAASAPTGMMMMEDPFAVAATASTMEEAPPPPPAGAAGSGVSERDFIASLGDKTDAILQIRIPNDPTQAKWNFRGQRLSMTMAVTSTIKAVKVELSTTHLNSMPANKIQLRIIPPGSFLKDNLTLAELNIGGTTPATLEMVPRARGRGRK